MGILHSIYGQCSTVPVAPCSLSWERIRNWSISRTFGCHPVLAHVPLVIPVSDILGTRSFEYSDPYRGIPLQEAGRFVLEFYSWVKHFLIHTKPTFVKSASPRWVKLVRPLGLPTIRKTNTVRYSGSPKSIIWHCSSFFA